MKSNTNLKVARVLDICFSFPILIYIAWSNSLLSDNFEQMPLRAIDDLAMQSSIHLSLFNFAQGDFSQAFYKFDYGYGWLFWNLYQLWVSPFALIYHLSPSRLTEKILILIGREFTLLLLILTILLIRKILLSLFPNHAVLGSPILRSLSTLLILLNPITGYWSGRVQPPALATFFLLCSIWILSQNHTSSSKTAKSFITIHNKVRLEEFLSYFFLGCAVGIKPNFVLTIGVYLYFYLKIKKTIKPNKLGRKLLTFLLGFSIGASPGILLNPNFYFRKYINTLIELSAMSMNYSFTNRNPINAIKLSLEGNLLGAYGLVFVAIVFSMSVCNYKKQPKLILECIFGLSVFIIPMVYVGMNIEDRSLVGSYLLPILILFPIFIFQLVANLSSKKVQILFISLLSFLITLNFFDSLDSTKNRTYYAINSWQIQDQLVRSEGKVTEQRQLKKLIPLDQGIVQQIFQDYEVPPPWSSYRSGMKVTYMFDNWNLVTTGKSIKKVWLLLDREKEIRALSDYNKLDKTKNVTVAENLLKSQIALRKILSEGKFGTYSCKDFKTLRYTHILKCEIN